MGCVQQQKNKSTEKKIHFFDRKDEYNQFGTICGRLRCEINYVGLSETCPLTEMKSSFGITPLSKIAIRIPSIPSALRNHLICRFARAIKIHFTHQNDGTAYTIQDATYFNSEFLTVILRCPTISSLLAQVSVSSDQLYPGRFI